MTSSGAWSVEERGHVVGGHGDAELAENNPLGEEFAEALGQGHLVRSRLGRERGEHSPVGTIVAPAADERLEKEAAVRLGICKMPRRISSITNRVLPTAYHVPCQAREAARH